MKTINGIILLIALMASQISYTQRAKDGDYIASTADNIVNSYTFLTSDAALGTNSILVDDNTMIGGVFTNDLAAGDLILIIQMQGADIAVSTGTVDNGFGNYTVPTNPPYNFWLQSDWFNYIDIWGGISSYNNAGNFEKVEVLSVTGSNTILLQCNLKNNYSESGKVQIVRIPRFDNLSVNGGLNSIIPEIWDGQTGGIVAIEVETEINVAANSSISASEFGFRGGELDPFGTTGVASGYNNVSFLGTSDPAEGSEKGEGIFGFHTELDLIYSRYGISGAANGGGGAGYTNAGGGGGSNIGSGTYTGDGVPQNVATFGTPLNFVPIWDLETPPIGGVISSGGGRGGYTIASNDLDETVFGPRDPLWGDDGRRNNGGRGGHPLTYDINRTFFGGGGGAGDQDSDQAGAGGRGGGIVFITSYGSIVGDGIIEVNGQDGQNSNPLDLPVGGGATRRGNDGAGGGGAAGSILIENIAPIPATIKLNAFGGDGGNQNLQYSSLSLNREAGGPGGAGAGGSISYSSGTPTQNLLGGTAGVTNSPFVENFNVNGATGGANGIGNFIIPVFDLATTDAIICTNSSVDLTATVTGSLPAGSDVEWYDQEFGGTSIWTGTTYTTPVLTATTTYYVTVCPGSFRIPVTVTITLVDDPTFTLTPTCDGGTATLTGTAGGTYTFNVAPTDGAVIDGTTGVVSGGTSGTTYDVNYATTGACAANSDVLVTALSADDPTFTLTPTCDGGTAALTGTAGGTYTFNVAPIDGAVIDGTTGVVSGGTSGTTYDVNYATTGACAANSDVLLTALSADDATFASADFCEASVNTITSVATVGGAYSIASQTGSGLVTIDGVTGILSNYTSGDQVTIQYTTPVGGCQNSSMQVVNVTNLDDASFASIDFCESSVNEISSVVTAGGVFAISNQTGSGSATINAVTGILTNYSAGDQISIEYTTPAGACQSSAIQVVNVVSNPVLMISDPAAVCEPDGVDITASSVTAGSEVGSLTYWSDAGATSSLVNASNITSGSVYYVQLENSIGCQSIAPVNVLFNAVPILNLFSSGGVYCSGDFIVDLTADVTGVADYTLQYTLDGVAQTATSTASVINIGSTEGVYVLTSLSDANCLISLNDTQEIVINTIPNAPVVTPNVIYCEGVEMSDLIATGNGGVFTWYSDMALSSVISNSSSLSPFLSPGQTNYYVTESNNGCEGLASAVTITIENCEITIPTAFTPDGDLTNDTWEILDIDVTYPDNIVRVFNRWGDNIFTSIQGEYNNKRWDGTYEGKSLPVGSYYFIIDYDKEGKENEKGVVSIILNK